MRDASKLKRHRHLASADRLAASLDREGRRVTGFVPSGFDLYVRLLNPVEHRDGSTSSWSAAWLSNGLEPSPWMQWDQLVAHENEILPDADGEPSMGDPHPSLARALIRVLARHHDLSEPHRFASWPGYSGRRHRGALTTISSEAREMMLFSGALLDEAGTPLVPVTVAGRVPMYWWPDDLSWCVGQDLYARSLILGCDLTTGAAILADPDLEAYRVRPDDFVPVEDF